MSLLQDIGHKLTTTARSAVDASEKFIEVSKLNTEVKSEEMKIDDIIYEMGKFVYDAYKAGKPVDEELSLKCGEISDCENKINELKAKIMEVKNLTQCPGCSAQIDRDCIYCPKCGAKLE